ncbi:MAG: glycosyltransferase [Dysgonamonadaceae bacterium]|nr:glycosyltransferase [Dysgonamonadaceae bacterium]
MDNPFRFSVIFCTYNREKYIYKAMESIALQNYPRDKYEIVLINNNSTDSTEELCNIFKEKYPDISFTYCVESQQGLSYARNRGIRESRGELLVYVDDDATVFPDYLKAYDDFFEKYPAEWVAGGPIIPHYETEPPQWLSYYTEVLLTAYLYKGEKTIPFKHGQFPGGGNACYRAEVFEKFGLFNVELGRKGNGLIGAEEKDFFSRLFAVKKKVWYVPKAGIYHYIPAQKLTESHFKKLTYSIGVSERIRTLSVSNMFFIKRLIQEKIKWAASIVLFCSFLIKGKMSKGKKLLEFRYYVTKGLLGF